MVWALAYAEMYKIVPRDAAEVSFYTELGQDVQ
jgi:tetrahydromethanopterin S-methyltransferase subunit C